MNLYDLNNLFEELYGISDDLDTTVDEGILDDISAKLNAKKAQKAFSDFSNHQYAGKYNRDPSEYIKANQAAQDRIEAQRQMGLYDAQKNSDGFNDEVRRRFSANQKAAEERRAQDYLHKENVAAFAKDMKNEMSKIDSKDDLDDFYYNYLDTLNKSTKNGLSYSDPLYKQLTMAYQERSYQLARK